MTKPQPQNIQLERVSDRGDGGGQKQYRKPQTELLPLTDEALNYLTKARGLRRSTLEAYRVSCNARGEIVIPFFDERDVLVLCKFRHQRGDLLHRVWTDRDGRKHEDYRKTDCESGGKPVLLGSHLSLASEGPLVICFGDYDAMACAQSGVPNCTSLPFGDKGFGFIDTQWDFLEQFDEIILFPDKDDHASSDAAARATAKLTELIARLGKHRCKIVRDELRRGTKDANEFLLAHGEAALKALIEAAVWTPEPDLVYVADYVEEEREEGTPIGIAKIDAATNGFGPGQLIEVGGADGHGKSTLVLNVVAAFVRQQIPVFFWTGEQRLSKIRGIFERILAGPEFLDSYISPKTGSEIIVPMRQVKAAMRSWYRDYFLQYINPYIEPEQFFAAAELGIRRHACGLVVIDNLMAFTGGQGEGYYQAQGDFVQSCKRFAETWNVPVLLVCHNKKPAQTREDAMPEKTWIEGSKKITNWADTVFQIWRVPASKREGELEHADTLLRLVKNRETGIFVDVRLLFDPPSQRFLPVSTVESGGGWQDYPEFGWRQLLGGYQA